MLISQQEPEITCTTYPFFFSLIKGACYEPEWPGLTGHFELQGCALSKIEGSLNLGNQRCPAFYLYEKCKIFWSPTSKSSVPWATRLCQSAALNWKSILKVFAQSHSLPCMLFLGIGWSGWIIWINSGSLPILFRLLWFGQLVLSIDLFYQNSGHIEFIRFQGVLWDAQGALAQYLLVCVLFGPIFL